MAVLVSRCRHSFKSEFKSLANRQITDAERFIPSYIATLHYCSCKNSTEMGLMESMATRDEPLTCPTNQMRHSNVAFYKHYCISYPYICTSIGRLACRMHYYYNKIFLVKQKAHPDSRIPRLNSVIPCFTLGHGYVQ